MRPEGWSNPHEHAGLHDLARKVATVEAVSLHRLGRDIGGGLDGGGARGVLHEPHSVPQTTGPFAGPHPLSEVVVSHEDHPGQTSRPTSTSTYPASRRVARASVGRFEWRLPKPSGRRQVPSLVMLATNRYPTCGSRRATDRCSGHLSLTPTNRRVTRGGRSCHGVPPADHSRSSSW